MSAVNEKNAVCFCHIIHEDAKDPTAIAHTGGEGVRSKERDLGQNELHAPQTLAQEQVLQMLECEDRSRSSQPATQMRIE